MDKKPGKPPAADVIYKIGSITVLASFAVLFVSLVFFNNSADYIISAPRRILQLIIALAAFFTVCFAAVFFGKLLKKSSFSFHTLLFAACGLLFTAQYFICLNISAETGWDPGNMVNGALYSLYFEKFSVPWLNMFPNNTFIFFFVRGVFWIFDKIGIEDTWLGLDLLNAFFMNLSAFVFCVTVKNLWGGKAAWIFFVFAVPMVILSPWMIIPYSDTFSMPVVAAACYFIIGANRAKTRRKRIFFAVMSGFAAAAGWMLKPFVLSVFASLAVVYFIAALSGKIKGKKKKSAKIFFKRTLAGFAAASVSFAVFYAGFQIYATNQNRVVIDNSVAIPYTYTFAMGMVETFIIDENENVYKRYGFFSGYVNDLASMAEDKTETKHEAYVDYVKFALSYYGPLRYAEFLFNKARWITSEGFFFWGGNGAGALKGSPFLKIRSEESLAENAFIYTVDDDMNFWSSFFYPEGKYVHIWLDIVGGVWAVVFLGVVLGCLFPLFPWKRRVKRGFNPELFLRLIPYMLIFMMLFTEAAPRYLLGYVPVFCAVSANGWTRFFTFVSGFGKRREADAAALTNSG
ncbi:MAG: hypothetical protein LBI38_01155 [Oscillospiraceae bacterium]|jgi:hypothetical protein|nr:hypothetical protein [Oscillospiraceae bacterium]